jgi:molybdate transport system regulatory protein
VEISARNKLPVVVKAMRSGAILAEVIIGVSDNEITTIITKDSAEQLDLKVGDQVFAIAKATEVMVGK